MQQPIYTYNTKHLQHSEIKERWDIPVPEQKIVDYSNCLLTPTNHLFVNGNYEATGLIKGHDDKKLSWYQQRYLYYKCRYINKTSTLKGHYIWCFDDWSGNYYHWFCETLPRIFQIHTQNSSLPTLLPSSIAKYRFVKESLEILGIKHLAIESNQTYLINELTTIQTTPRWSIISPSHQKNLVEAIKRRICSENQNIKRKIYLSRKKAPYRHIINEEEIIPLLKKNGYEIICAEDLTFKDQVVLFSQTNSFIALHGAGHTNMMFMPQGGKVLEFRNKEITTQPLCYFELANIFELKWSIFNTETTDSENNFNDVFINLAQFEHALIEFEKD